MGQIQRAFNAMKHFVFHFSELILENETGNNTKLSEREREVSELCGGGVG